MEPPQMQTRNSPQSANLSMSEEAKELFESELCWCIKQLQGVLQLGKLNPKQIQNHTKALNSLMSKNTSLVKKRQVMRLSFGDYRKKMAEDDRKFVKVHQQIKVTTKIPNTKSVFLKKSTSCGSNHGFSFNFQVSETNKENSGSNLKNGTEPIFDLQNSTESGNYFKFNFNIPC